MHLGEYCSTYLLQNPEAGGALWYVIHVMTRLPQSLIHYQKYIHPPPRHRNLHLALRPCVASTKANINNCAVDH